MCRCRPFRRGEFRRLVSLVCSAALLIATTPVPLQAQVPPPAVVDSDATAFSVEQLDALLAPVALYPDALLAPVLMAATFPVQVVEAARWADDPANRSLSGDALTRALVPKSWDPSVKSLVPLPQVLVMMNSNLEWLQQLGYAMTVQQGQVWDSVQRLRRQAQAAGQCQTTAQQVVRTEGQIIVIEPAQPNVVYVPAYNPTVVYGSWPYAAYPPVYLPPPPAYYPGTALLAGLAFGAGVAITAGLWGWARPNWGYGNTYVNVHNYNSINVHRTQINNSVWRPAGPPPGRGGYRPPPGPVGPPVRPGGLPANGIGRPAVSVPGGVVRPPSGIGPGNRPPINLGSTRPGGGPGAGQPNRPGGGPEARQPNRPSGGPEARQPNRQPGGASQGGGRTPPAFSGTREGGAAAQFGNRGAQSRQSAAPPPRAAPAPSRQPAAAPQRGGGGAHGGRRE